MHCHIERIKSAFLNLMVLKKFDDFRHVPLSCDYLLYLKNAAIIFFDLDFLTTSKIQFFGTYLTHSYVSSTVTMLQTKLSLIIHFQCVPTPFHTLNQVIWYLETTKFRLMQMIFYNLISNLFKPKISFFLRFVNVFFCNRCTWPPCPPQHPQG